MNTTTFNTNNANDPLIHESTRRTTSASAVSWGAIFAGAAGAAALSLLLLMLGVGLGLSSMSPWANQGAGAAALGISTVLWLTFTQLAASGMGGYLAGRLRSRWTAAQVDEVYFRDTAHGFLAWSVATLATAALLTSSVGAILGGTLQAGASVAGGAASTAVAATGAVAAGGASSMAGGNAASGSGPMGYALDALFRKDGAAPVNNSGDATASAAPGAAPSTPAPAAAPVAEMGRIFANAISADVGLSPEDTRYAGQLVAQRTGLSQADAEKRVTEIYTRTQARLRDAETAARDAADKARKASAYATLWMFISLLIGAFVASLAATYGGRRRDL